MLEHSVYACILVIEPKQTETKYAVLRRENVPFCANRFIAFIAEMSCKISLLARSNRRRRNTTVMFRRASFFVLFACLVVGSTPGQQTQPPSAAPQSASTTQPLNAAALKKIVGFLRVGFLKDGQAYVDAGTCFFVVYEDKRLGDNGGFVYLVTNRHVAVPRIDEGQGYPVQWTRIRLNLRSFSQAMESEEANPSRKTG
jgi:hypothetical protein